MSFIVVNTTKPNKRPGMNRRKRRKKSTTKGRHQKGKGAKQKMRTVKAR